RGSIAERCGCRRRGGGVWEHITCCHARHRLQVAEVHADRWQCSVRAVLEMIATSPIERALAFCGGSHALADIEAAVATGAMQRWDGDESAIITEIRETPRQRILLFFLAGGQMAEL